MTPLPESANRLALGLMAHKDLSYPDAVQTLNSLILQLVCDGQISTSLPLQAALITAVNTGRRAFLGGLKVELPPEVPLLLPWPDQTTLNGVVRELMPDAARPDEQSAHRVFFGTAPNDPPEGSVTVRASGWRGGIEPAFRQPTFHATGDSNCPLGGIFAAGLAIHRGFLRLTGISPFACEKPAGLSLWKPEADWRSTDSEGPIISALPESLWSLGLGHLGQAFLWTLGLLPFADSASCELMLQDFDRVETANLGSGLLCDSDDVGLLKTRVCSRWLEARRFRTRLCDRRFDGTTRRTASEPEIALCGFDKPEPRRNLEDAGFLRVLECGLGGSINDFDMIHFHGFPGRRRAADLWKSSNGSTHNARIAEALSPLGEACGALAIETAGKSVATSFVGSMASALMFAELLRGLHGGRRYDEIFFTPRNLIDCEFVRSVTPLGAAELARAGFVESTAA